MSRLTVCRLIFGYLRQGHRVVSFRLFGLNGGKPLHAIGAGRIVSGLCELVSLAREPPNQLSVFLHILFGRLRIIQPALYRRVVFVLLDGRRIGGIGAIPKGLG